VGKKNYIFEHKILSLLIVNTDTNYNRVSYELWLGTAQVFEIPYL